MAKSSSANIRALRQALREGEVNGRPVPWDPERVKSMARLRKALITGLQGPDADNFEMDKIIRRLQKR